MHVISHQPQLHFNVFFKYSKKVLNSTTVGVNDLISFELCWDVVPVWTLFCWRRFHSQTNPPRSLNAPCKADTTIVTPGRSPKWNHTERVLIPHVYPQMRKWISVESLSDNSKNERMQRAKTEESEVNNGKWICWLLCSCWHFSSRQGLKRTSFMLTKHETLQVINISMRLAWGFITATSPLFLDIGRTGFGLRNSESWGRGAEWNKLPVSFNGAHEEENCISYAEKLLGNKSNLF